MAAQTERPAAPVVVIRLVFVVQRLGNVTRMKSAAFAKKLRADLRQAQNIAMTRNGGRGSISTVSGSLP